MLVVRREAVGLEGEGLHPSLTSDIMHMDIRAPRERMHLSDLT